MGAEMIKALSLVMVLSGVVTFLLSMATLPSLFDPIAIITMLTLGMIGALSTVAGCIVFFQLGDRW